MEPKEEIRQRIDIADLISEYLTIKPAGSGSFKALCPFHNEKTPSFHISRDKQIWHCFGCAKGGDLFAFMMEMEGMDFLGALRFLGKKAGVEVDLRPKKGQGEHDKLRELHVLATTFYQTVLHKHELGRAGKAYIERRGIDIDLAKTFELGCAPDKWDALTQFLRKKGIEDHWMEKAGLAKKASSGDLIDRFRNRLMIPLHDAQGRVVGFTARLLGEQTEKSGPKYLNSPETEVYRKSEILFGYHLAKRSIRQEDAVIVVEGNLDVIASHKAGVKNIVASSGTALTQQQLAFVQKQTNRLLMCFDADSAGFTAAQRGIHLAQGMGFDVDVILIPEDAGKDPDDVVKRDQALWKELVAKPVPVMQYYINRWSAGLNTADPRSKRDFVTRVLQELGQVRSPIERQHWLQMVADMTRTDIVALERLMGSRKSEVAVSVKKTLPAEVLPKQIGRSEKILQFVIGAVFIDPALAESIFPSIELERALASSPTGEVYKMAKDVYSEPVDDNSPQKPLFERLRRTLQDSENPQLLQALHAALAYAETLASSLDPQQLRSEVDRHIALIKTRERTSRKQQLAAQIRQAEQAGDSDLVQRLLSEYKTFTI